MKKLEKTPYVTPTIKVVTFKVEKGFQASLQPQNPTTENRFSGEEMVEEVSSRWGTF